jgi:hypothetical protein
LVTIKRIGIAISNEAAIPQVVTKCSIQGNGDSAIPITIPEVQVSTASYIEIEVGIKIAERSGYRKLITIELRDHTARSIGVDWRVLLIPFQISVEELVCGRNHLPPQLSAGILLRMNVNIDLPALQLSIQLAG